VTEYFFWPRKDAWEELKAALDTRGWIGEREKVLLLNQCTEVSSRVGRAMGRGGAVRRERAAGPKPVSLCQRWRCCCCRILTPQPHRPIADTDIDARPLCPCPPSLLLALPLQVINYWQDENKHSLDEARSKFPNCKFQGS
jgi:hypothetical protein